MEEIYQTLMAKAKEIPIKKIKTNTIPPAIYLQETEELLHWIKEDIDQLKSVGLAQETVDATTALLKMCREGQSVWQSKRISKDKAAEEWKIVFAKATVLRDELFWHFRFACRDDERLAKRFASKHKTKKVYELELELSELKFWSENHKELLDKINFDFSLIDQIEDFVSQLSKLSSMKFLSKHDHETKNHRNRLFFLLKEHVDQIKDYGKFALRHNGERLKGYQSQYLKNKNQKLRH